MNHWHFILGAYGVTLAVAAIEILAVRAPPRRRPHRRGVGPRARHATRQPRPRRIAAVRNPQGHA